MDRIRVFSREKASLVPGSLKTPGLSGPRVEPLELSRAKRKWHSVSHDCLRASALHPAGVVKTKALLGHRLVFLSGSFLGLNVQRARGVQARLGACAGPCSGCCHCPAGWFGRDLAAGTVQWPLQKPEARQGRGKRGPSCVSGLLLVSILSSRILTVCKQ